MTEVPVVYASGTDMAQDGSGVVPLLREAIRATLAGEGATAEEAFGALAALPDGAVWAAWGLFAAHAGQGHWDEARALLPALLAPAGDAARELTRYEPLADQIPEEVDPAWQRDGEGDRLAQWGMLRLTGLGVDSRYTRDLPDLDNQRGTWVEFVVRRNSTAEGDCRLEIADGTVTETVVIDPGAVRLLASGVSVRWPTSQPHLYGLWIGRQTCRLYADGQLLLEARGLPAASARQLSFGVYHQAADSESHWYLLRVTQPLEAGRAPSVLPPPWPVPVWTGLVDALMARQAWPAALSLTTQARVVHPDDPAIEQLVGRVFAETVTHDEAVALAKRALHQLPLRDRATVAGLYYRDETAQPLVVCDGLGIQYRRGQAARRSLTGLWRSLFQRAAPRNPDEYFWAVRNVSFELRPGEMLGIIGRNGAGKTTLLNALADLIEPDEGEVRTHGQTMLLSVGTGFIPALTGRENIYLSGLYLGMTRREIDERFDEIVEFAELWDAIDRPFRTYSTGMMSRLQFALATTVNPDILMLDELLGAGDAAFVEKSQARMQQLLRRARGVVVITHDLDFVRHNCSQAILLEHGEVLYQGSPETAALIYHDLLVRKPKRAERADAVGVA